MRSLLLLLLACHQGPASPGGGDDTDTTDTTADTTGGPGGGPGGGGGGEDTVDTDLPRCTTTCWSWGTRAPSPRPGGAGGAFQELYTEGCNFYGLEQGVCPDTFTCEGRREVAHYETFSQSIDPCVGDLGPHTLVIDVPLVGDAPAEPTVPVHLHFTLSGEIWPGGGEPGQAGRVVFTRNAVGDDTAITVEAEMPVTRNGRVDVDLPAGTWTVGFSPLHTTPLDTTRWPTIGSVGTLQVIEEEEVVEVDVNAASLTIPLRVDGDVVTEVPAGVSGLTLGLWSPSHGSIARMLTAGDSLSQPFIVEPDLWDLTLTVQSDGLVWPNGGVTVLEQAVAPLVPNVIPVSLQTAAVSGEVLIDRARPALADGVKVWWGAQGFAVGQTSVGRYAGRVWAGQTYVVSLDGNGAIHPAADLRIQAAAAPGVVDVRATTASMSGVVTLNRATPGRGTRGSVQLLSASGGSIYHTLATSGDAAFSARVWQESYDVWVVGDGDDLPGGPILALPAQAPRDGLTINVTGFDVDLTLTVNGRAPDETSGIRGAFILTPVDPTTHAPLTGDPYYNAEGHAVVPGTGAAVGSVLMPRGTFSVAFQPSDLELPVGNAELGVIDLTADLRRTYDLQTVTWNIDLQHNGANLPVPATGDRGYVMVNSGTAFLPARGASRVQVETWPGPTSVLWVCPEDTCGLTPPKWFLTLYSGLITER